MIRDEDRSSGSGLEPTKVDLGDDLIEKTAIIPGHALPAEAPGTIAPSQIAASPDDQIQSARILLNEGFPEEAKKTLRQILLADPAHVEAKKILEEIHESELKQMFGTAEPAVRKSFTNDYDESILDVDSEEVVRLLDRDVGLGLESPASNLSFFSDERLLAQFADKIDRELGSAIRDRIDLAIGFMEMGLYSVAIRLLQSVLVSQSEEDRLNASALAAYAHLLNDEPYRAVAVLQYVLNDGEIEKGRKTECFYLMGRARQALSAYGDAAGWYLQAVTNEPGYRDCAERLARCKSALADELNGK